MDICLLLLSCAPPGSLVVFRKLLKLSLVGSSYCFYGKGLVIVPQIMQMVKEIGIIPIGLEPLLKRPVPQCCSVSFLRSLKNGSILLEFFYLPPPPCSIVAGFTRLNPFVQDWIKYRRYKPR